jgi:hypothetical protein
MENKIRGPSTDRSPQILHRCSPGGPDSIPLIYQNKFRVARRGTQLLHNSSTGPRRLLESTNAGSSARPGAQSQWPPLYSTAGGGPVSAAPGRLPKDEWEVAPAGSGSPSPKCQNIVKPSNLRSFFLSWAGAKRRSPLGAPPGIREAGVLSCRSKRGGVKARGYARQEQKF